MSASELPEGWHPHTRSVDKLQLPELEAGQIHRLWLKLSEDALGRAVRVPVLVARGLREGPTFGITAAVHGNEVNGIPVIHSLFSHLDLRALRGAIVAVVVVNVPGYQRYQRRMIEGMDLNTLFPGHAKGNVAQLYAHRLLKRAVRHFDRLVDLHTASFGRINSLYVRAEMDDPRAREMAYLLRPQIILHNRAHDKTLRGTATARKIPAVTIEIGDPQRFQPAMIKQTELGIRRLLAHAEMLPKRKIALGPPPIVCDRSRWLYTDRGGLLEVHPKLTDRVCAGEEIATLTDLFGMPIERYRCDEEGVVIGKSVNPVGEAGARIAHIGIEAERGRFPERERE